MARRNIGQMKCRRCGRWHTNCLQHECIADDVWAELTAFAIANGRTWKSKLREEWLQGRTVLQWARNIIGPTGLDTIRADARRYERRK